MTAQITHIDPEETIRKLKAKVARLEKANQAMLEALKLGVGETLDYISRNHLTGAENNQWIVQARAAIAKGEPQ